MTAGGSWRRLLGFTIPVVVAFFLALGILLIASNIPILLGYSLLVLSLSLWLAHKTVRAFDLNHLSIPAVWYLSYLATMYFPGFFVYFDGVLPYRERFMFAMQSVSITVPLGFVLVNRLVAFKTSEVRIYYDKPIKDSLSERGVGVAYALFLIGGLGLTLLYLTEVQHIALIEMIKNPGDWAYYQDIRLEAFGELNSPFIYAYYMLRTAFYPILIAGALGFYLRSRDIFWLVILLVSALLGLTFASFDASKGPVSIIVLVAAFLIYLYKAGKIRKLSVVFWVPLLLAFPVFILLTAGPSRSVEELFDYFGWRIFIANSLAAYKYFEIFPDEVGFLYGRSIRHFAQLTGRPVFDAGNFVYAHLFEKYSKGNSAGGAFFAAFYADFGMPGVILGGILAGIVLQVIQVYLIRREKTIPWLSVWAFLFMAVMILNGEPLPVVLLSRGVGLALVVPWVVVGISGLVAGRLRKGLPRNVNVRQHLGKVERWPLINRSGRAGARLDRAR